MTFHVVQSTATGDDVDMWDYPTWGHAERDRCARELASLAMGGDDTYSVLDDSFQLCESDPAYDY